jgi:hypothetical protein
LKVNTTPNPKTQSHPDLIDFPVSDSFRNHYAAQGLTYPVINLSQPYRRVRHTVTYDHQLLDSARQELLGWKSKAALLESRCARLETEVNRLQDLLTECRKASTQYTTTNLSGCA